MPSLLRTLHHSGVRRTLLADPGADCGVALTDPGVPFFSGVPFIDVSIHDGVSACIISANSTAFVPGISATEAGASSSTAEITGVGASVVTAMGEADPLCTGGMPSSAALHSSIGWSTGTRRRVGGLLPQQVHPVVIVAAMLVKTGSLRAGRVHQSSQRLLMVADLLL